jgi:LL-diaminopimelate aminotransferase
MAGIEALTGPQDHVQEACATYKRRRDLVIDALREIGIEINPPKGTIYIWAPVPEGRTSASFCEEVLDRSAVVVSPGTSYGPNGEGFSASR